MPSAAAATGSAGTPAGGRLDVGGEDESEIGKAQRKPHSSKKEGSRSQQVCLCHVPCFFAAPKFSMGFRKSSGYMVMVHFPSVFSFGGFALAHAHLLS